jgi:hypothetical protein
MSDSEKLSFSCFLAATALHLAALALDSEPLFWTGMVFLIGGLISWPD